MTAAALETPRAAPLQKSGFHDVPLVPVALWGTQRLMTKDHPRDFSRGKTIGIRVGEPMHPTGADPAAARVRLAFLKNRRLVTGGNLFVLILGSFLWVVSSSLRQTEMEDLPLR